MKYMYGTWKTASFSTSGPVDYNAVPKFLGVTSVYAQVYPF